MSANDEERPDSRKSPTLPGLDSLLQRQPADAASAAAPSGRPAQTPAKSLQQILEGETTDARIATPPSLPPPTQRHQRTADLLDQSPNAASGAMAPDHPQRPGSHPLPGIEELINPDQRSHTQARPHTAAANPAHTAKALDSVIRQTAHAERPNTAARKQGRFPWLALAAGGLIAALAAALVYHRNHKVPDPGIARSLLAMAEDIGRYRATKHKLPERLGQLPSFPKDAVEWPIENYAIQLASPNQEYFLVDTAGGYIVIGPLGDEAWLYDSAQPQPLRRVPAN